MANAKTHPVQTPTAKIISQNAQSRTVTDTRGRVIEVRKLNAWDKMEVARVVGPENTNNEYFFMHAMVAYAVSTIDGMPYPPITNLVTLKARVTLLDDDGLSAVAPAFAELHGSVKTENDEGESEKN